MAKWTQSEFSIDELYNEHALIRTVTYRRGGPVESEGSYPRTRRNRLEANQSEDYAQVARIVVSKF